MEGLKPVIPEGDEVLNESKEVSENIAEQIEAVEGVLTEQTTRLTNALVELEAVLPEDKQKHASVWNRLVGIKDGIIKKIEDEGNEQEAIIGVVIALSVASVLAPEIAVATAAGAGVYALSKGVKAIGEVIGS